MSDNVQIKINTALRATKAATVAGDVEAANYWWRQCVGSIELSMGRTGSAERLTPDTKPERPRLT